MPLFERPESAVCQFGKCRVPHIAMHTNPGIEATLVEAGRAHWWVEDERYLVPADCLFVTFPGVSHGNCPGDERERNMLSWVVMSAERKVDRLHFHPDLRVPEMVHAQITQAAFKRDAWIIPATDNVKWLIREMVSNCRADGGMARARDVAYAQLLLAEIADGLCREHVTSERCDPLQETLEVIRARCDEDWTLQQMASRAGLKRSRFAQKCRKLSGDRPMDYLYRCRAELAAQMLLETEQSITEIAFACGFCSSQHLARRFRRIFRMRPTQYRLRKGLINQA